MANITVKRLPKTMDYYYIKILLNHHVNNLSTCDDKEPFINKVYDSRGLSA